MHRHVPRLLAMSIAAVCLFVPSQAAAHRSERFEVWLVDQSNSPGLTYGGRIHIYKGSALMGKRPANADPTAEIDLGAGTAALCLASTGANPVRPHMLFFNQTDDFAILSFVASGHVVIFDAGARTPLACLRMSPGAGGAIQAHAAFPAPDDSFILVANQNGKLLQRIDTDYHHRVFTLNTAATVNLATCTTPNGMPCQDLTLRPDNAPICPLIDSTSSLGFVTLRGGGLFVVDPRDTPMSILAEYDRQTVHGNGCGGAQARGSMFIDSGGGTATNLSEFDLYRFPLSGYDSANPPNTPAPHLVFSDDATPDRDAHGVMATKHGRYVWVADRHMNVVEVFRTRTNTHAGTIDLVSRHSADPTPDLLDLAPSGERAFISLRGPNPLSGDPHVATGTTPGLMVVGVEQGGRQGKVLGIVRVSNVDAGGVERADPHGIRVRRR